MGLFKRRPQYEIITNQPVKAHVQNANVQTINQQIKEATIPEMPEFPPEAPEKPVERYEKEPEPIKKEELTPEQKVLLKDLEHFRQHVLWGIDELKDMTDADRDLLKINLLFLIWSEIKRK